MKWYNTGVICMYRICNNIKKTTGFTLVEVLLVIAILAILAAVTIIAINPARQLAGARDAERLSDVYLILSTLHQYAAHNDGTFPEEITLERHEICRTGAITCDGLSDLSVLTDGQVYTISLPMDPRCQLNSGYCSEYGTGYFIKKTESGRVTVFAPGAELSEEIVITR